MEGIKRRSAESWQAKSAADSQSGAHAPLVLAIAGVMTVWSIPLWGSLASCGPIANRTSRRLPTAAQDAILPHRRPHVLTVRCLEGFQTRHRLTYRRLRGPVRIRISMRTNILLLLMPVCLLGQTQDSNYRALRDGKLAESYNTENIVLQRDAGTLTFKSGALSLLAPVLGRQAVAVFIGQGRFHLKPALPTETARLWFTIGTPEMNGFVKVEILTCSL